jgi:tetratricopeptide (TPR) repeat protein
LSERTAQSSPTEVKGPTPGFVIDQRFMLTAVLATVIVILAVVVSIVLYGLEVSKAPRTVAERAVATSEAATREQPKAAQGWVDLTYAYVAAGRYTDARAASAAGKKVEDLPAFYIADAYMLEKQGKTAEAIDAYETAKQRATAYHDKRVSAASAKGATYATANADLADAAIFKARLLAKQGDAAAALVEYDIALKVDPQMSDVLVERADVKASLGDLPGARADYKEALRFIPDLPEALKGLEKVGNE